MVGSMNDVDKINIVLHEYDSLRDEIIQRWVGTQTDISVGVLVIIGVLTAVFSSGRITSAQIIVLGGVIFVGILIFGYGMWQVDRDTRKAAQRLREIESEVNQRAGEEILKWETRWGGAVTGFWGSAKP
jgi:uncharacterized membrane protein